MKNCRLHSAVVFAAVLLLPVIDIAAQPIEPSELMNKLDTAPLDYYLDKADMQALEEQWLRYARFGLGSSLSRWENEVLLLMGEDFDLSSLKSDAQQQLNGIIEQHLAAWLSRSFFGNVSPPSLGRLDAGIENLNRQYLYRRDADGNSVFDEDGNPLYKTTEGYADLNSGGSIISRGEKSLWNEGAMAVIDQLMSDWTGAITTAHADLLSGIKEPELRMQVGKAYDKDFGAFRAAYRRQLNQLFYQEQSRFMQLRLYDQSSLERQSGRQTADNVSNQLIAETQAELNAGLDLLAKSLNGQTAGVEHSGGIVNADDWRLSFRNLLEQGVLKWDRAEEELLMERVNWEQSAGKDIAEGEKAWAEAFRSLRVKRTEWMSLFRQTLEEGNQLWTGESHELEAMVSNAVSEIDKSLANSKASLQSRIDNLAGMLLESVNMMRTARTSWEYWMDQADGGEKDSFDASETGFDIWQLRRRTAEAAMPYLTSFLEKEVIMHSLARLEAGGKGPRPGLWMNNLSDGEKKDIFDSFPAYLSLRGNARTVRYNQFSAGIDEVFGRARQILDGTLSGAAALTEAFYWCENIFGVYQNYAVESQDRLGETYGILVFDNPSLRTAFDGEKLTGALLGDEVIEDDQAWENLFIDNWQAETLKARAYLQYWQKQKEIAQAVFDYASDESSTKESADETKARLQISKSSYDSLLSGYSDLIGQLNSLGSDLEEKQASMKIIQAEIEEYQTQLSSARAEYQTLVTDLTADNPEYLAEQFRGFYLQLLASYGMDPGSQDEGLGTAFEEYLLAAGRYGLEEEISLVSAQLVRLLGGAENTDLSSPYFVPSQASFAELHRRMKSSAAAGFKPLDAAGGEELFSLENKNGINDFQTYLQNRLFLQFSDPRFDKMAGLFGRYHEPDGAKPAEVLWEMERIVRDIKSEYSLQYEIRLAALRLHTSADFHSFAGRYFSEFADLDETAASLYDRIAALPKERGLDDLIPEIERDIEVYDHILMLYDIWCGGGSGDFILYDWDLGTGERPELVPEQAYQKIWDSRAAGLEATLGRVPAEGETADELVQLRSSLSGLRLFLLEAGTSSSYKDELEAALLEGPEGLSGNLRLYLNGGDSIGGLSCYLDNEKLNAERRRYALTALVEKGLGTSASLSEVHYEKTWSALIERLEEEGLLSGAGGVFRSPGAVWSDKSFKSVDEVFRWFVRLDSWAAALDLPSFMRKQLGLALSELKKYSAVRAAQLWGDEIPADLSNINQEIRTESEKQISAAALLEHFKDNDDVLMLWKITASQFVPGEIREAAEERFIATAGFDLARKAAVTIGFDEASSSWKQLLSEYLADFSLGNEEGISDYEASVLERAMGSYALAGAIKEHEPAELAGPDDTAVYNASIWNSLDFDDALSSVGGSGADSEHLILLQTIDILLDGAEVNGMPSDAELEWVYDGNTILREVDSLLADDAPSLWAAADFDISSGVMGRYLDESETAELKLRLKTGDPLSAALNIWDEKFYQGGEGYAVLGVFAGLNLIHSSFVENGYYSPEFGFNELFAELCADAGFGDKETALLESIEQNPAAGLSDFFSALDSDNPAGLSGDALFWNLMWRAAEDYKAGSYSIENYRTAKIFGGDPYALVLKNWLDRRSFDLDACRAEYQAELDNQVHPLRTLASLPGGGVYEEILAGGLGSRLMRDSGLSADAAAITAGWFLTEYGLGEEIGHEKLKELSTSSGEDQLKAILAGRAAEFEHYLKKKIAGGKYSEDELCELLAAGGVLTRQQKSGLLEMLEERDELSVYNRLMHGDIGAFTGGRYSTQEKILRQRGIYQRFLGLSCAQWDDPVFTPGYGLEEAGMSSIIDSLAFNRTRTADSTGNPGRLSPNDVFLSFAFEKLGGSFLEELSEALSLLHSRRELYILSREYMTAQQTPCYDNWRSYLKSEYLVSDDDQKDLIPEVYAGPDSEDYGRNLSIVDDGAALESFTELRIFYGNALDNDNFILDASNTYLDSAAFLAASIRRWTAPEPHLSGDGKLDELAGFIEDEPDEDFLQNLSSMQWGELAEEYSYEPDAAASGVLQEKLRDYDALFSGIGALKANLGMLGRRREQLIRLSNGPGEAVAAALLPIKTRISDFEGQIDAARLQWQELIDGPGGYKGIETEYSEIYEDAQDAASGLEEARHDYLRARAIFDYASAGYLSIDEETLAAFDPESQDSDDDSGQSDDPSWDITEGGISNGTIIAADVDTGDGKTDEQKLRDRLLDIINKVSPKLRLAYADEKLKRAEGAYNALLTIIQDNQDNMDIYGKDDVYRSYFNAYLETFRESLALSKINTVLNKAIVRQEKITSKALADWRKDLSDSYSDVSIRDNSGSYKLPGRLTGLILRKSGDGWNISWGSGAQAGSVPAESQAAAYFEAEGGSVTGLSLFEEDLGRWLRGVRELQKNDLGRGTLTKWAFARKWEEYNSLSPVEQKQLLSRYLNINNENDLDRAGAQSLLLAEWESAYNSAVNAAADEKWMYDFYKLLDLSGSMKIDTVTGGGNSAENLSLLSEQESIVIANEYMAKEFRKGAEALIVSSIPVFAMAALYFYLGAVALAAVPFGWIAAAVILAMASFLTAQASIILGNGTSRLSAAHHIETEVVSRGNSSIGAFLNDFRNDTSGILQKKSVYDSEYARLLSMKGELDGGGPLNDDERIEKLKTSVVDSFNTEGEDLRELLSRAGLLSLSDGEGAVSAALGKLFGSYQDRMTASAKDECGSSRRFIIALENEAQQKKQETARELNDYLTGQDGAARRQRKAEDEYRRAYHRYLREQIEIDEFKQAAEDAWMNPLFSVREHLLRLYEGQNEIAESIMGSDQFSADISRELLESQKILLSGTLERKGIVDFRQQAERDVRIYELQMLQLEMAERRLHWENQMSAITARGQLEWTSGERKMNRKYEDWINNTRRGCSKQQDGWNDKYLAFLSDKQAWLDAVSIQSIDYGNMEVLENFGDMTAGAIASAGAGIVMGGFDKFTIDPEEILNDVVDFELIGKLTDNAMSLNSAISGVNALMFTRSRPERYTTSDSLQAIKNFQSGKNEEYEKHLAILGFNRLLERVEYAEDNFMKQIESANQSMSGSLHGTMRDDGYILNGSRYERQLVTGSTLWDYIYEDGYVSTYSDFIPERIDFSGELEGAASKVGNMDADALDGLVVKAIDDIEDEAESIFGDEYDFSTYLLADMGLAGSRGADGGFTFERREAVAAEGPEGPVEAVAAWLEDAAAEISSWFTAAGEGEAGPEELAKSVDPRYVDISPGLFGAHVGFAPAFTDAPDMTKSWSEEGQLKYEGYGEMGRIMGEFIFNKMKEGSGWGEVNMPHYKKKLWNDPDALSMEDVSGMITTVITAGAGGIGEWEAMAVNLADDLAFTGADVEQGVMTWDEGLVSFGRKASGAALATLGGDLLGNPEEGTGLFELILNNAARQSFNNATGGLVNSLTYSSEGGFGYDTENLVGSVIGKGAMAGYLGSAAELGMGSLLEGSMDAETDAFYGSLKTIGSKLSGAAGEYAVYAGYRLAEDGFDDVGGSLSGAFDEMGLSVNVLDMGSMLGLGRLLAASGTDDYNDGFLGNLAQASENLSGTGLFALNFSSSGISGRITTGGISLGSSLFELGKGFAADMSIRAYNDKNGNGALLRKGYAFGDRSAEDTVWRLLRGKDTLKFGRTDGKAMTVRTAGGGRNIYMDKRYNNAEGNDLLKAATVLQHESHRDGLIGAGNEAETCRAVKAHTEMARGLSSAYGLDFIVGDKNLTADIIRYMAFRGGSGSFDEAAFAEYVDDNYDSSGDYWKLMNDGSMVNDNEGWLKNEEGKYINIDGTFSDEPISGKTIGAAGVETGLLNILNGQTSNNRYGTYSAQQITAAQQLMISSGMMHTVNPTDPTNSAQWMWDREGSYIDSVGGQRFETAIDAGVINDGRMLNKDLLFSGFGTAYDRLVYDRLSTDKAYSFLTAYNRETFGLVNLPVSNYTQNQQSVAEAFKQTADENAALPQFQPGYPTANGMTHYANGLPVTWCNGKMFEDNNDTFGSGNYNSMLEALGTGYTRANNIGFNLAANYPEIENGALAQEYANIGLQVRAAWINPQAYDVGPEDARPGHVASVVASYGVYDPRRGPRASQAGNHNGEMWASQGFGANNLDDVKYYWVMPDDMLNALQNEFWWR